MSFELPPGLERALALAADLDPDAASAARALLGHVLVDADGTRPDAPLWRSSRLGAGGFPVELAFAAGDPSLRLTLEVASPGLPLAARVARALEHLGSLPAGTPGFALAAAERLAELRGAPPRVFGAWLGARFWGASRQLKLYVELPAGGGETALAWARDDLGELARLRDRAGPPVMLGIDEAGGLELYFRARDLGRGELPGLFAPAGDAGTPERTDALVAALARAAGRGITHLLPCRDVGLSLAWHPGGGGTRITLYTFARSLFGGDGRIRAATLAAFTAAGWPAPLYEAISRPLAGRRGAATRHGMFGLSLGAHGAPAPVVGLAPEAAA